MLPAGNTAARLSRWNYSVLSITTHAFGICRGILSGRPTGMTTSCRHRPPSRTVAEGDGRSRSRPARKGPSARSRASRCATRSAQPHAAEPDVHHITVQRRRRTILAQTQHSCHQTQSDRHEWTEEKAGGLVPIRPQSVCYGWTLSNPKGLGGIRIREFNWDRLAPLGYRAPHRPAPCLPGIVLPVAD